MKPVNLLKMLPRTHPKGSTFGFTIIELMVVVLIIGILSAIAAPGWDAFISRQRTRTVNDGVFQALRKAQSDAKLKKEGIPVIFQYPSLTPSVDPPTVTINGIEQQLNANGEIKAGMVTLVVRECQPGAKDANDNCTAYQDDGDDLIQFDYLGAVEIDDPSQELPFAVSVSKADGGFKRCVIVETILGSMRTAEGEFDSATGAGCP
ncbi:MAG: type II secretion system protein [Cyanobacteria bacterium P01_H01_bin.35]